MADRQLRQSPWARLRAWMSQTSHLVLITGGLSALAALVAVSALAVNDFRSEHISHQNHAAMLARVLEDQATRTMQTAELSMESLATSPALTAVTSEPRRMQEALGQALAALSFLRGLAVVDAGGRVIASTSQGDAESFVDLSKLGPPVEVGRTVQGGLIPGRSLQSVRLGAAAQTVPVGVAFIPVLYGYQNEARQKLVLVALVNPDSLSNFQHLTLESEIFDSVVTSYEGQVLATSGAASALAGTRVNHIPVFSQYLPRQEHATYLGAGVLGERQIVSFRASSALPLVVVVETSYRAAVHSWLADARALIGIGVALVALVLGLTFAVWRGLRTRERARVAIDAAQARIARNERDLSVLMRSVQELIFRTDAQGVITYVNAHWTVMTGTPPDRAIGKRIHDLVEPQSRMDVERAIDPRSPDGVRACQVLSRSPEGKDMIVQVAVVPLVSAGRVIGFAGSAVDETERWMAQQQLQAQIAFQDLLLETNPLPISVTDADNRIVRVNKAWEEYKGRERSTVLGMALAERLPPDEVKVHESANKQLLRWGGRTLVETQVRHGDGSRRDTRLAKAAIADEHGKVTGVLTILMDVSEFREAERATQEARDAAEEASRAKSEFVANMSHELRTPLQSILGFAELGMLRGRTQPKLAGMFEDIHSAGQRMLTLVNDLLEVSKLESTVGTFHMERIDLRGVVRPVIRELEPLLERSHLMMDLRMPDLPLVAKADPLRFQQVIRNVVANAIKFSPPGSTITLEGYADPQGQTHLVVRDEGPGIPPSELQSIFEAFVQSSKTKDGSGGTGLGLAICRKIVEAMGGRIFAENVPASGAAFHIILPARGQAETMPAPLE
ncbi:ATP-binding protein [Acidovorax sp. ST3]|uniref:sensor histidine kinase n=1 Tax=Acidovorax sp. ST3 TaxID=2219062 RepID=UPI000DA66FE2|nr:ATP-binding protein [Acidovorax sp. ST3]